VIELKIYDCDDVITMSTFEENNHQIRYTYEDELFTITQNHSLYVSDVFTDTVDIVSDEYGLIGSQIDIDSITSYIAEWYETN